jgi:hypothetical protein
VLPAQITKQTTNQGEEQMANIAAILSGAETADRVIQQLAELNLDELDWRVFRPEVDHERLMPGWPAAGAGATGSATGQPMGAAIVADLPEETVLSDKGIPDDEADYYSQSLAHGATVLVVETAAEHLATVRRLLEEAGATRISTE